MRRNLLKKNVCFSKQRIGIKNSILFRSDRGAMELLLCKRPGFSSCILIDFSRLEHKVVGSQHFPNIQTLGKVEVKPDQLADNHSEVHQVTGYICLLRSLTAHLNLGCKVASWRC